MKSEEARLLELFDQLTSEQQDKLIAFAEFLAVGAAEGAPQPEPVIAPRPPRETVTMAVRRLVRSYPMLDRRPLLGAASECLAQHALQGRPAADVIDELERLFAEHYRKSKARGA